MPLTAGRDRDFSGGLLDGRSRTLIHSAVHVQGAERNQEEPDAVPRDVQRLPEIGVPVLYGGILHSHFGHFMLESLGRLWGYERVRHLHPYVAFHPVYRPGHRPVDYSHQRGFAYQVFTGLGIPVDRVLLLDRPTRLKQVLVPPQLYGYGLCRNPADMFVEHIRRFSFPRSVPRGMGGARKGVRVSL